MRYLGNAKRRSISLTRPDRIRSKAGLTLAHPGCWPWHRVSRPSFFILSCCHSPFLVNAINHPISACIPPQFTITYHPPSPGSAMSSDLSTSIVSSRRSSLGQPIPAQVGRARSASDSHISGNNVVSFDIADLLARVLTRISSPVCLLQQRSSPDLRELRFLRS